MAPFIAVIASNAMLHPFTSIVADKAIDRQQCVKIGDTVSSVGYPNGGVPQGTLSGPKNFLVQINDIQTPCPMFKYVDDSTVFDVCNNSSVPMLQESAEIITDWSRNNDMRINGTKTK